MLLQYGPTAHPRFNQDKGQCSKKFNHCAAKYEVAVSVFRSEKLCGSMALFEELSMI